MICSFWTQDWTEGADNENVLNKPEKRYAVDVQRHTVFFCRAWPSSDFLVLSNPPEHPFRLPRKHLPVAAGRGGVCRFGAS